MKLLPLFESKSVNESTSYTVAGGDTISIADITKELKSLNKKMKIYVVDKHAVNNDDFNAKDWPVLKTTDKLDKSKYAYLMTDGENYCHLHPLDDKEFVGATTYGANDCYYLLDDLGFVSEHDAAAEAEEKEEEE